MSREAILCIDDEAIILMSLKQELRLAFGDRFSYETALNADDAKSIIEELAQDDVKVALIITDLLMPGTNGDEFLVEVKHQYPDIRAILITGHADRAAVERTMRETGAVRVFQKPWRAAELLQAVSDCLEGPANPGMPSNPDGPDGPANPV